MTRLINYVLIRVEYYRWLLSESGRFDILMLRHSTSDPFQWLFLLVCSKEVYIVHHTLEIPELSAIGGRSSFARIAIEHVFGRLTYIASKGFIGVTGEIVKLRLGGRLNPRKRLHIYPNGVEIGSYGANVTICSPPLPQIIFVASFFSPWHGLDRLLDKLEKSPQNFSLHIVGALSAGDEARARMDPRIILHGHLASSELKSLLLRCDVGLSSFALDRNRMTEACPLKVREYLALGLPVYSGHKDVFPDNFRFFRHGPPDIDLILNFYNEISKAARTLVVEEAAPYIEKSHLLSQLYTWLKNNQTQSLVRPTTEKSMGGR